MLTGSEADADDLAQETLMRAFASLGSFNPTSGTPGGGIKAWLLRILRNLQIDRIRAAGSRVQASALGDIDVAAPQSVPLDTVTDPHALLDAFSDAQIISALKTLPDEMRWTLLLTEIEGLDHSAAAEILEVPAGTVKSRVHRAKGMLREALLPIARDLHLLPRATGGL